MECRVVDSAGAARRPLDREVLERQLAGGFFWLDVQRPSAEDLELLADVLDLHPLAVEDSLHLGQRPKLEEYASFVFMVLYGHVPDDDLLVEVHLYVTEAALVTIHSDDAPALDELHASYERHELRDGPAGLVYRIADGLVDGFFPALSVIDEQLDEIEDRIVESPTGAELRDIFAMRRTLASLRRVVGPQRDVLARIVSARAELPGLDEDLRHSFRDVLDHLLRLGEQIEATRDVVGTAIEVYLSASSNRMNAVMKQLTLIASIFLPLTFITGFFGQNFGWLVDNVGSWEAFLLLGIGSQLLGAAILALFFFRRGWF